MSDSLRPHESQHARPPCPSPTPGAYSNSCLSSRWCDPAISSSVIPFSSCPQSLPASESFSMSQLFTWGGQITWVSASASVHPMNAQDWFRMHWLDLLAVQGTLKSFLQHHSSKASIFRHSAFFTVHLSHPYMAIGKTIALTRQIFVGKVMSLITSPTTDQKNVLELITYHTTPFPHLIFKNLSLKAIWSWSLLSSSCLDWLLAWGPAIDPALSFSTNWCQQVGFTACRWHNLVTEAE